MPPASSTHSRLRCAAGLRSVSPVLQDGPLVQQPALALHRGSGCAARGQAAQRLHETLLRACARPSLAAGDRLAADALRHLSHATLRHGRFRCGGRRHPGCGATCATPRPQKSWQKVEALLLHKEVAASRAPELFRVAVCSGSAKKAPGHVQRQLLGIPDWQ